MVKGKVLDLNRPVTDDDAEQEMFAGLRGESEEQKEVPVLGKRDAKPVPVEVVIDELTIDSPSELWELGHVSLKFKDVTSENVDVAIRYAQEKFETMRKDLLGRTPVATVKAVRYAQSLALKSGGDVEGYDWSTLTAAEVTDAIEQFSPEEKKEKPAPFRKRTGGGGGGSGGGGKKSYRNRKFSGGGGKRGGFTLKDPDAPMTESQAKRIEADCEDAGVDLPDGFGDFTMQEASDFIQKMAS